jgi:hypothetical protein
MRRLVAATSIALAGALAPTVVNVAPASAETRVMHDPVGDDVTGRGFGDVKRLRVHYGAHRLKVTIKSPKSGDPAFFQDLYVDTWPKHPGPEVLVSTNGDAEAWSTSLGGGWDVGKGKARCGGAFNSVHYDYRHGLVRYQLPRTCLMPRGKAQPPKLRFSLAIRSETEKTYDWLPGKRTFGRWVHWK